jgi:cytochrome c oxidase subunit 3
MFKSFFAQRHAFHLVDPSALPLLTSISALSLTSGSVLWFHGYIGGLESTFFGIFCVLVCFFL